MKIFYIDTPIDYGEDMECEVFDFMGRDCDILPRLPKECEEFFRREHCDVIHSFVLTNYYYYGEESDIPSTYPGFVFTKPMMDADGRYGIRIVAVGISTADPERFFKEMKEAIFDEPLTNPEWHVAFGCVVGYDFVCVDKEDVGWMQEHFPGVEFNIMYKLFVKIMN